VRPALHGGWFLAPTTDQRLNYPKYLCVWGKEKVHVPDKLKIALSEFNVCLLPPPHTGCNTDNKLLQTYVRKKEKQSDQVWIRGSELIQDPFHPYFILGALQDQLWMKTIVFGSNSRSIPLLPTSPEHANPIYELFQKLGELNHISHISGN